MHTHCKHSNAMNRDALKHRLATRRDLPALKALMALAIDELQKPFLSDAEIISSRVRRSDRRLRRLEQAGHALWERSIARA